MPTFPRSRQPPGVVVLDFRPLARSFAQLGDTFTRAGAAAVNLLRQSGLGTLPPIPLHGFTPNYDLICAVCQLGPEECRGGRA